MTAAARQDTQEQLVDLAARVSADPLAFVMAAFPWRTGSLIGEDGPDVWQREVLTAIRDGLLTVQEAIQLAIASGHGPGKSALVCWVILWALMTYPDTRGVVTANTEAQLRGKTWPELAKWHRMSLWSSWFELGATTIFSTEPGHDRTWRIDAVAWSERSVESFAGLHNAGKRILCVMDEASAIPDVIWETVEGALTDRGTQILWLVAGNPTRNSGRFRECFGRFRHRWHCWQVDSRTARMTNKAQIAQWIADYGEDRDFVRVRVRGVFPRAGSMQFIPGEMVDAAMTREADANIFDALVLGCDIARFGDDSTVIWARKGRDARTIPPIRLRGADTMTVAGRIAEQAQRLSADAVFIDGGGLGAGVVDRCRQLNVRNVFDVQFGSQPNSAVGDEDMPACANLRAQIWSRMREWLRVGTIPSDQELRSDLTGTEYGYNMRSEIQLEKKTDM
jgi:hypothetical protein